MSHDPVAGMQVVGSADDGTFINSFLHYLGFTDNCSIMANRGTLSPFSIHSLELLVNRRESLIDPPNKRIDEL